MKIRDLRRRRARNRPSFLTFSHPRRPSFVLTLLKSWVRPDAFHSVLEERSGRWYNACLRITRDAELAADAVQEALLKAWDRRNDFRGEAALDSWIHRIALNAAIDMTRRRRTRAEDVLDDDGHEAPESGAPERDYALQALTQDLSVAPAMLDA